MPIENYVQQFASIYTAIVCMSVCLCILILLWSLIQFNITNLCVVRPKYFASNTKFGIQKNACTQHTPWLMLTLRCIHTIDRNDRSKTFSNTNRKAIDTFTQMRIIKGFGLLHNSPKTYTQQRIRDSFVYHIDATNKTESNHTKPEQYNIK